MKYARRSWLKRIAVKLNLDEKDLEEIKSFFIGLFFIAFVLGMLFLSALLQGYEKV